MVVGCIGLIALAFAFVPEGRKPGQVQAPRLCGWPTAKA
jgi:hypothetical protein